MTKTQRLIGGSIASLLFISVSMFSMCGVRMQKVNTEDDFLFAEEDDSAYQEDLLNQLEFVDDSETTDSAGEQGAADDFTFVDDNGFEIESQGDADTQSEAFDINDFENTDNAPAGAEMSAGSGELVSEAMVSDLRSEIQDLQNLYEMKEKKADDLRQVLTQERFADIAQQGVEQTASIDTKQIFEQTTPDGTYASTSNSGDLVVPSYILDTEFGQQYQAALDYYNARQYSRAISKFRNLLVRADAGKLADNCQYWIGESYYALGDYYQAVAEFEKVNAYSEGNKVSDAQLMVGLALMKAGETQQARSELNTLLSFYQNAPAAQKAQRYLGLLGQV